MKLSTHSARDEFLLSHNTVKVILRQSDGLVKISKGKLFHNLVAETDKALLP